MWELFIQRVRREILVRGRGSYEVLILEAWHWLEASSVRRTCPGGSARSD